MDKPPKWKKIDDSPLDRWAKLKKDNPKKWKEEFEKAKKEIEELRREELI